MRAAGFRDSSERRVFNSRNRWPVNDIDLTNTVLFSDNRLLTRFQHEQLPFLNCLLISARFFCPA